MSKEALAHIKRGQEAFSRGDLSVMVELTTPDAEWGATGIFPGIGDHYRGSDAIRQWAEIVRNEWEEFEVTLGDVLHEGDDLVVVEERLRGRGRLSGVEVEMSVYSAYWLTEDGRICRRAAFAEPHAALEAAGLAPR